jgi:cytochrome c biogenesis protein CcdA/thiol-disulfide isomerase/thioredoxin
MLLPLLAYLGGVLTILSPCILPVLPFVFARADRPFMRSGLPMLVGMALTFAAVATLAAVAGGWAVAANQYGRAAALVLLALFGLALLFPELSDRATRPLVRLGSSLSNRAAQDRDGSVVPSLLLGVATGLLWAPCAGPVLGLILTGAALGGANVGTTLLLLAYAAGAGTSLALALLVGGQLFRAMKRSLGAGEWVRRALGVAVMAGVAAIAFGLDTGLLTQVSLASTASVEQTLIDTLHPNGPGSAMVAANDAAQVTPAAPATPAEAPIDPAQPSAPPSVQADTAGAAQPTSAPAKDPTSADAVAPAAATTAPVQQAASLPHLNLPVEGTLPPLAGAVEWLNSPPLTAEALKGKVVLVDFWTYSCINCLRSIPYVKAWAEKYKDQGLIVIGVHAPEFAFEKKVDNVRKAVADLHVTYPVAIDNDYAIWRSFKNQYWPAHYFIDAQGRIRHHHFGEGEYDQSEHVIQQLLAEAGRTVASDTVTVDARGAEQASADTDVKSPETYVGASRAENFISPGGAVVGAAHTYAPGAPKLNQWGLKGNWTVGKEHAALNRPEGAIVYRFHARDLHLVLGPGQEGRPVRFRVTVDGAAPGDNHGVDIGADGQGTVTSQRLYQLVRQTGAVGDHTFEITFLDPGVQAYAFTFG